MVSCRAWPRLRGSLHARRAWLIYSALACNHRTSPPTSASRTPPMVARAVTIIRIPVHWCIRRGSYGRSRVGSEFSAHRRPHRVHVGQGTAGRRTETEARQRGRYGTEFTPYGERGIGIRERRHIVACGACAPRREKAAAQVHGLVVFPLRCPPRGPAAEAWPRAGGVCRRVTEQPSAMRKQFEAGMSR